MAVLDKTLWRIEEIRDLRGLRTSMLLAMHTLLTIITAEDELTAEQALLAMRALDRIGAELDARLPSRR